LVRESIDFLPQLDFEDIVLSRNWTILTEDILENSEAIVKERYRGYEVICAGPVVQNPLPWLLLNGSVTLWFRDLRRCLNDDFQLREYIREVGAVTVWEA